VWLLFFGLSQKCGSVRNGMYVSESMWCVLVIVIIRWGYCSGATGMWQAKHTHFE